MKPLNDFDSYLLENPKLIDRFLVENSNLFKAIKDKFKLFLDAENLVGRYLLARALNDLVRDELKVSKGQIKEQAFKKCGLVLMDADNTKHGGN